MVIDTDAGNAFLQSCFVLCGFFPTCEGYPCDMLPVAEGCDATLGSGLIENPKGDSCGVTGGGRYMVDAQPNLSQTFECVAKVGTDGDGSERPMEAMIASVGTLNKPAGCNEGFLRKDALLVVTFITDEEDDGEGERDRPAPADGELPVGEGREHPGRAVGEVEDAGRGVRDHQAGADHGVDGGGAEADRREGQELIHGLEISFSLLEKQAFGAILLQRE
jgi:hypothetical protein